MTRRRRGWSDITVTDQFCGAGGSSIGAASEGLRIRMAMNHWELAVETHNTNFPNTDHDTCDISAADPRRYPSTDILITSPECTTHSPAGGNVHRKSRQTDLFIPSELDPATQRSRATMWDVVRFTEYHEYKAVIVENVVEVVRTWPLFWTWWKAMETLGYVGQLVCLNSMFALPTPQSRDRVYIVWTRDKRRKPDLNIEPAAPCAKCGHVEARQTWRAERAVGKYGARNQYWYTCPRCRSLVAPYYYCALNAIDLSIPAVRIGDRDKPLKPKTRARVAFGLEKYGRRPLQITTNQATERYPGDGIGSRVRGADDPSFAQTGSWTTALVSPWLISLSQSTKEASTRVRSAAGPAPSLTTCDDMAIAGFNPFLYVARENVKAKGMADPSPSLVASENQVGVVSDTPLFNPFLVTLRTNANGKALDDAVPAITAGGGHHMIVQPSALVRLNGSDRPVHALDAPNTTTTTGADQHLLISRAPYLIQYYGSTNVSSADEPVPAQSTHDRHGIIRPGIDVDDCYFRMFGVGEVGATMAFPGTYQVLGTNSEQVKQYGNAVTPPAMKLLVQRVVQCLTGERWLPVRAA